ncbi:MAG: DegT/DnrJ/EryC1/StrS family aminotransferase [Cyanobacteria bacterium P01_G01_bin.38]
MPVKTQQQTIMAHRIPISQPSITALEIACVTDAMQSGWVSSRGEYIDRFEETFAAYCGTQYALTTSSGTTALHLALASYGIQPGDEVIVPNLTFVATANAVSYVGAKPIFVDIDPETLCIDVKQVEQAITARTKAVVAVHLYGHPANIPALQAIAKPQGILVIEDAAEAHGATIHGQKAGALGDCGVFSFFGNKIVTCGEGGMLTTNDPDLYKRALHLRNQAMSPTQRYWHTEVGFNYRMTNLQAALGFAQLKRIDAFIQKKKAIFEQYQYYLSPYLSQHSNLKLNRTTSWADNVFWQICLEVDGWTESERNQFMQILADHGIESRPYFYPLSDMPMYNETAVNSTPVAHQASQQGLNLPSFFEMSDQDIKSVCSVICESLNLDLPTELLQGG